MNNTLIVFTGLPGTGKTTMSRTVAKILGVPLIAKDDIKEIMYDTIGWSDKQFSAKQARATFAIMAYIIEGQLTNGRSLVIEANYWPEFANPQFQSWQERYKCNIIQIVCQTEIATLAQRFFSRQQLDRHPGHLDTATIQESEANFIERMKNGEDQPLDVHGPVRIVDTTDFSQVDTNDIAKWVQANAG